VCAGAVLVQCGECDSDVQIRVPVQPTAQQQAAPTATDTDTMPPEQPGAALMLTTAPLSIPSSTAPVLELSEPQFDQADPVASAPPSNHAQAQGNPNKRPRGTQGSKATSYPGQPNVGPRKDVDPKKRKQLDRQNEWNRENRNKKKK
jgi:hypothetical protein